MQPQLAGRGEKPRRAHCTGLWPLGWLCLMMSLCCVSFLDNVAQPSHLWKSGRRWKTTANGCFTVAQRGLSIFTIICSLHHLNHSRVSLQHRHRAFMEEGNEPAGRRNDRLTAPLAYRPSSLHPRRQSHG